MVVCVCVRVLAHFISYASNSVVGVGCNGDGMDFSVILFSSLVYKYRINHSSSKHFKVHTHTHMKIQKQTWNVDRSKAKTKTDKKSVCDSFVQLKWCVLTRERTKKYESRAEVELSANMKRPQKPTIYISHAFYVLMFRVA